MSETKEWTPEQYQFLLGRAKLAAYSVVTDFPTLDVDDLVQEALMWAVTHPGKVAEWLEHDSGIGRVVAAMKNAAKKYAVAQRALQRGDEAMTDDVWYTLDMLKGAGRTPGKRGLLHLVFDEQAWVYAEQQEKSEGKTKKDPAEGNNWLATLADVSKALDQLKASDPKAHTLIGWHYRDGYTYDEIAGMLNPPVAHVTVVRRMDRAVRKVQEFLGGARPRQDEPEEGWQNGPGGRHAISNAHARALTDRGYDA